MSFPLNIQPLIIEDDEDAKDTYNGVFETLRKDYSELRISTAPPCFAFSFHEALECLDSSKIFHVVILDLRLPDKPRMPAVEGVDLGLNLLARCVERDKYPIPALLVISGHIGSTEQARMQESLRNGFHYGRQFVKGDYGLLEEEIRQAFAESVRYCSVGIHFRDAGDDLYPTITPRDEDLLRRSSLQQHGAVGLDLNWWSAKRADRSSQENPSKSSVWTKVLMGRYLFDDGRGASRPRFFKLMPGSDAQFVIQSARHLEHKLTHVKLTSAVSSKSTALIVTEKVGAKDARPRSLEEFLRDCQPAEAHKVAVEISDQVRQLGDLLPDSKPLKSLLWTSHDHERLSEQWRQFGQEIERNASLLNPVSMFSEIMDCSDTVRLNEMSVVHGDLHMSIVALDVWDGNVDAYIFDPGVIAKNVAGKDMAALEVSAMLHQRIEFDVFVQICSVLYRISEHEVTKDLPALEDPIAQRILEFIRGLREGANSANDLYIYALMVFDFALIQLGGLAFGSSGNMIWDHRSAAYLASMAGGWFQNLRAQFASHSPADTTKA